MSQNTCRRQRHLDGTRLAEPIMVNPCGEVAKGAQVFTLACKSCISVRKTQRFLADAGRFVGYRSAGPRRG